MTSLRSTTSSSKPQSSRGVIRQFHVLLKEQAKLRATNGDPADVQSRIDELGGIEVYQSMSAIGQGNDRGGGSEKIFIGWLKELNLHKSCPPKLKYAHYLASLSITQLRFRLLEVGYVCHHCVSTNPNSIAAPFSRITMHPVPPG